MKKALLVVTALASSGALWAAEEPPVPAAAVRVASLYLSEDFINQLLRQNLTTPLLKNIVLSLDPQGNQIVARGLIKIPTQDLKAVNLDPGIGDFQFQLAIRLEITQQGHLILIFPLDQTYFYPAGSTDPEHERIVIPVQLLSLALASARGYLAMYSGDFSGFDKKIAALTAQMSGVDKEIALAKDPGDRAALQNDRKSLQLQLEAIPVERRQAQKIAKKVQSFLGFVGEKEINLNEQLSARKNALILRIQLGQMVPYLQGVELGGIRLLRDDKDGPGMNFMAIDVNARLVQPSPEPTPRHGHRPHTAERPPFIVIRLNQAILESQAIVDAEKGEADSRVRRLSLDLREDGIHIKGDWRLTIIPIPFETTLQLVWTGPNVFEIRVSEIKVVHLDIKPIARIVLDVFKRRLDRTLKGVCAFQYIGEEKNGTLAVRAGVDMTHLLPAFPKLALTGVQVKDKELLLKAGAP